MEKINTPQKRNQAGASAIEYAIIASVIALVIIAAVTELDLMGAFKDFMEAIRDAVSINSGSGTGGGD